MGNKEASQSQPKGYITDHYSVLGLPRDADPQSIHSGFQRKIKQYHPDRYEGLAPEFKARAEAMTIAIVEAHNVLSDEDVKRRFDQQLDEWQGPVSKDGTPIIDISHTNTLLSSLVNPSGSIARLQSILDDTSSMSGYEPSTFEFLKQQYKTTDTPSPELESAYMKALALREVALSLEESFRRDHIGLKGGDATTSAPTREYLALTGNKIREGRERISNEVARIVYQLQSGEMHLLEAGEAISQAVAHNPSQALSTYRQQAIDQYDTQAEEIERIATEREQNMVERLKLFRGEYVPEQKDFFDKLIVCFQLGKTEKWIVFQADGDTVVPDSSISEETLVGLKDLESARTMISRGYNIVYIEDQDGLSVMDELNEVVNKHYESFQQTQEE